MHQSPNATKKGGSGLAAEEVENPLSPGSPPRRAFRRDLPFCPRHRDAMSIDYQGEKATVLKNGYIRATPGAHVPGGT